jgi:lipopolysaccharide transport system ATP-binding protein
MIKIEGLCKTYKLYQSPADRLKEIVFGKKCHREFAALRDISFDVGAGQTLGIVGQNGAGKSTLLKLLLGILFPDKGRIHVDGKVTGLLELTTGFSPDFTGLQNIYLNGTLRGMSKREIDAKLDQIVRFAELGEFINEPIKTYSSGMVMRLAFSTAIHADPEAFVVDEALSVGDAYFQQKCMHRIGRFKESGGSIVFVSHEMNAVKLLCDSALLLHEGEVVKQGDPDEVIRHYNYLVSKQIHSEENIPLRLDAASKSHGTLDVVITSVKMLGAVPGSHLFFSGDRVKIQMEIESFICKSDVTSGILIRDRFGQDVFGTNTFLNDIPLSLDSGKRIRVVYDLQLNIGPGKYTLTAAIQDSPHEGLVRYCWCDHVVSFEVVNDHKFIGIAKLEPIISIEELLS